MMPLPHIKKIPNFSLLALKNANLATLLPNNVGEINGLRGSFKLLAATVLYHKKHHIIMSSSSRKIFHLLSYTKYN